MAAGDMAGPGVCGGAVGPERVALRPGWRCDMADPVFLITGASSGIGEATARHAAEAGYRLVLAARRLEQLEELAAELGGAERAIAVRCDVTEWDDQQALAAAALDAFGRIDVAFANAGFGGAARLPRVDSGALASDGAHERLRRGAHDPRHAARAARVAGPLPPDRLRRRPPRAPRLALLGDQVGRDRDGRGRAPGARRHRHPRHADRARDGRHAVLRPAALRARSSRTTWRAPSCSRSGSRRTST